MYTPIQAASLLSVDRGDVVIADLSNLVSAFTYSDEMGAERTLTLTLVHAAAPGAREFTGGRVVRIERQSAKGLKVGARGTSPGTELWRIDVDTSDADEGASVRINCVPLAEDLTRAVARFSSGQVGDAQVFLTGRTAEQALEAILDPENGAPAHFAAGTVDASLAGIQSDVVASAAYTMDLLNLLCQQAGCAWRDRVELVDGEEVIAIDLVPLASPDTDDPSFTVNNDMIRAGQPANAQRLTRVEDVRGFPTALVPISTTVDPPVTVASAVWKIEAAAKPAGAPSGTGARFYFPETVLSQVGEEVTPIVCDGALNGLHLLDVDTGQSFVIVETYGPERPEAERNRIVLGGSVGFPDGRREVRIVRADGTAVMAVEHPELTQRYGRREALHPVPVPPYAEVLASKGITTDMSAWEPVPYGVGDEIPAGFGFLLWLDLQGQVGIERTSDADDVVNGTSSARFTMDPASGIVVPRRPLGGSTDDRFGVDLDGFNEDHATGHLSIWFAYRLEAGACEVILEQVNVLDDNNDGRPDEEVRNVIERAQLTLQTGETGGSGSFNEFRFELSAEHLPVGGLSNVRLVFQSRDGATLLLDALTAVHATSAQPYSPVPGPRGLWLSGARRLRELARYGAVAWNGQSFDTAALGVSAEEPVSAGDVVRVVADGYPDERAYVLRASWAESVGSPRETVRFDLGRPPEAIDPFAAPGIAITGEDNLTARPSGSYTPDGGTSAGQRPSGTPGDGGDPVQGVPETRTIAITSNDLTVVPNGPQNLGANREWAVALPGRLSASYLDSRYIQEDQNVSLGDVTVENLYSNGQVTGASGEFLTAEVGQFVAGFDVTGSVDVTGNVTADNIGAADEVSGAQGLFDFVQAQSGSIDAFTGGFTVAGGGAFTGDLSGQNLTLTQDVTAANASVGFIEANTANIDTFTQNVVVQGGVDASGPGSFGSLNVAGAVTADSVTADEFEVVQFVAGFLVDGDVSVDGDMDVTGTGTFGSIDVGTIIVDDIEVPGDVRADGTVQGHTAVEVGTQGGLTGGRFEPWTGGARLYHGAAEGRLRVLQVNLGGPPTSDFDAVRAGQTLTLVGDFGVTIDGVTSRTQTLRSDRSWTVSTPQDLQVTAAPTFGGLSVVDDAYVGGEMEAEELLVNGSTFLDSLTVEGAAIFQGTVTLTQQATAGSHAVRADRSVTLSGVYGVEIEGGASDTQAMTGDLSFSVATPQDLRASATPSFAEGVQRSHVATLRRFGAETTGGDQDWNAATNTRPGTGQTLLAGNDLNGPTASTGRFHPWNLEYGSSRDGTGNVTQLAIPYAATPDHGIHIRGRYNGPWSPWYEVWTSGNDGAGSGLDADLLHGASADLYARLDQDETVTGEWLFTDELEVSMLYGQRAQRWGNQDGRSLDLILAAAGSNSPFVFQTANALQFNVDSTAALLLDSAANATLGGHLDVVGEARFADKIEVATLVDFGNGAGDKLLLSGASYGLGVETGALVSWAPSHLWRMDGENDGAVGMELTDSGLEVLAGLEVRGGMRSWSDITAEQDVVPDRSWQDGGTSSLGRPELAWASAHVGELVAEVYRIEEQAVTAGGVHITGFGSVLARGIGSGETALFFRHNGFAPGDWIVFTSARFDAAQQQVEATREVMQATAASPNEWWEHADGTINNTQGADGVRVYLYTVTRGQNGTAGVSWTRGATVANLGGVAGYAFIEQRALNSVVNGAALSGPATTYYVRTGGGVSDVEERAVIGNLVGTYGYSSTIYGAAFGADDAEHITIENTNGLRFHDGGEVMGQLASNVWTLGRESDAHVEIRPGIVYVYGNNADDPGLTLTHALVQIGADGEARAVVTGAGLDLYDETDTLIVNLSGGVGTFGPTSGEHARVGGGAFQLRDGTEVLAEVTGGSFDLAGGIVSSDGSSVALASWTVDAEELLGGTRSQNGGGFVSLAGESVGNGRPWYGTQKSRGLTVGVHTSGNGMAVTFGQLIAPGNASSSSANWLTVGGDDVYGIGMVDHLGREYFALGAVDTSGGDTYNRIAGWAFDDGELTAGQIAVRSSGEIVHTGGAWGLYDDGRMVAASGALTATDTSVVLGAGVILETVSAWATGDVTPAVAGGAYRTWAPGDSTADSDRFWDAYGGHTTAVVMDTPIGSRVAMQTAVSGSAFQAGVLEFFPLGPGAGQLDDTEAVYRWSFLIRVDGTGTQFTTDPERFYSGGGASGETEDQRRVDAVGGPTSNPYFHSAVNPNDDPVTRGRWYLVTNYVFPASYTDAGHSNRSTMYDAVTGEVVHVGLDYTMPVGGFLRLRLGAYNFEAGTVFSFTQPVLQRVGTAIPGNPGSATYDASADDLDLLGLTGATLSARLLSAPTVRAGFAYFGDLDDLGGTFTGTTGLRISAGNFWTVDDSGSVELEIGGDGITYSSGGPVRIGSGAVVTGNVEVTGSLYGSGFQLQEDTGWIGGTSAGTAPFAYDGDEAYIGGWTVTDEHFYRGTGVLGGATFTGVLITTEGGLGRIEGYDDGDLQASLDSDGRIRAGGGTVTLDADGLVIENDFTGFPGVRLSTRLNDDGELYNAHVAVQPAFLGEAAVLHVWSGYEMNIGAPRATPTHPYVGNTPKLTISADDTYVTGDLFTKTATVDGNLSVESEVADRQISVTVDGGDRATVLVAENAGLIGGGITYQGGPNTSAEDLIENSFQLFTTIGDGTSGEPQWTAHNPYNEYDWHFRKDTSARRRYFHPSRNGTDQTPATGYIFWQNGRLWVQPDSGAAFEVAAVSGAIS